MSSLHIFEIWLMVFGIIYLGVIFFAMFAVLFLTRDSICRKSWKRYCIWRQKRRTLREIRKYIATVRNSPDFQTWRDGIPEKAMEELIRAGKEMSESS